MKKLYLYIFLLLPVWSYGQDLVPEKATQIQDSSLLFPSKQKKTRKNRLYKPFKVGLGLLFMGAGAAFATYERNLYTLPVISLLYVEPQYAISDKFGVGLRSELLASYLAILNTNLYGDYYFTKKDSNIRPSIGLGAGFSYDLDFSARSFTLSPRVRLHAGHFMMGLSHYRSFKPSYDMLMFNLGWEFVGGRYIKINKRNPDKSKKIFSDNFKLGLGTMSNLFYYPSESITKVGLSVAYIEPQFFLSQRMSTGVHIEFLDAAQNPRIFNISLLQSDVYLRPKNNFFNASVGMGVGLYTYNTDGFLASSTLGFSPRGRLQVGPMVAGLSYHIPRGKELNNFLMLHLGAELGGGTYIGAPKRTHKDFKLGAGLSTHIPLVKGRSPLWLLPYLEPQYFLLDNLSIGIRGSVCTKFDCGFNSISLQGDYYFSPIREHIRLSAGIGIGSYNLGSYERGFLRYCYALHPTNPYYCNKAPIIRGAALAPRARLHIGHFVSTLSTQLVLTDNNHIKAVPSIDIGWEFGGGTYDRAAARQRRAQQIEVLKKHIKKVKIGFGLLTGLGVYHTKYPNASHKNETLVFIALAYIEPQYMIGDKYGLGLRIESMNQISHTSLQADYYFRPRSGPSYLSVGLGIGKYKYRNHTTVNYISTYDYTSYISSYSTDHRGPGLAPRIRLHTRPVVLSLSYHTAHLQPEHVLLQALKFGLGWEMGGRAYDRTVARQRRSKKLAFLKKYTKNIKIGFSLLTGLGVYHINYPNASHKNETLVFIPIVYIEPQYMIGDKYGLGLRMESMNDISHASLQADYYFRPRSEPFRFSAGLGIGIYEYYDYTYVNRIYHEIYDTGPGLAPRIQLHTRPIVLSLSYHTAYFQHEHFLLHALKFSLGWEIHLAKRKKKEDK